MCRTVMVKGKVSEVRYTKVLPYIRRDVRAPLRRSAAICDTAPRALQFSGIGTAVPPRYMRYVTL